MVRGIRDRTVSDGLLGGVAVSIDGYKTQGAWDERWEEDGREYAEDVFLVGEVEEMSLVHFVYLSNLMP